MTDHHDHDQDDDGAELDEAAGAPLQTFTATDDWWRRIRDQLDDEQRRKLYAGELSITTTDLEDGVRTLRLVPPAWLRLEEAAAE